MENIHEHTKKSGSLTGSHLSIPFLEKANRIFQVSRSLFYLFKQRKDDLSLFRKDVVLNSHLSLDSVDFFLEEKLCNSFRPEGNIPIDADIIRKFVGDDFIVGCHDVSFSRIILRWFVFLFQKSLPLAIPHPSWIGK